MITVELFEANANNIDACSTRLQQDLLPLYVKQWDTMQRPIFGKPFSLNAQIFIDLLLRGISRIFIAYESGQAIGFCVCIPMRPMQYEAAVLQVHDFFSNGRSDVHEALMEKVEQAASMLACDELWIDTSTQIPLPAQLNSRWSRKSTVQYARYTKA